VSKIGPEKILPKHTIGSSDALLEAPSVIFGSQMGPHLETKSFKMEAWNVCLNLLRSQNGPNMAQGSQMHAK